MTHVQPPILISLCRSHFFNFCIEILRWEVDLVYWQTDYSHWLHDQDFWPFLLSISHFVRWFLGGKLETTQSFSLTWQRAGNGSCIFKRLSYFPELAVISKCQYLQASFGFAITKNMQRLDQSKCYLGTVNQKGKWKEWVIEVANWEVRK